MLSVVAAAALFTLLLSLPSSAQAALCADNFVGAACDGQKTLVFCSNGKQLASRECDKCTDGECVFATSSGTAHNVELLDHNSQFELHEAQSIGSCDETDAYALTKPLTAGTHSKDISFGDFQLSPDVPADAIITQIRLRVLASTLNVTNDALECSARDVRLKHRNKHTSADRGSPRKPFATDKYGWIEYGDRFDIWEAYGSGLKLVSQTSAELNIEVSAKGVEESEQHTVNGTAQCGLACAQLIVNYIVAPKADEHLRLLIDSQNHEWHYKADNKNPSNLTLGTDWRARDFDADGWKTGRGPFGNKKAKTEFDIDPPVAFLQTKFTVTDEPIDCYRAIKLKTTLVSGGRMYLNGALFYSLNVDKYDETAPPVTERALRGWKKEDEALEVYIPSSVYLLRGENTLAVGVYQSLTSNDDDDLEFDLELSGLSTCAPPATTATSAPKQVVTDAQTNVQARSGNDPLIGYAIAALVVATIFCCFGCGALYYAVFRKRRVVKI